MSDLQLGPFTPDLCEILDGFEVDLRGFLQYLSGTVEVGLGRSTCATFLVVLGKVDIQTMEIGGGLAGVDGFEGFGISLGDLRTD